MPTLRLCEHPLATTGGACALALLLALGCRHAPAAQPRASTSPAARDGAALAEYRTELVRLLGLAPLDEAPLADGRRELRLWVYPPFGSPVALYRLRGRDSAVRGSAAAFWTGYNHAPTDSAEARYWREVRGRPGCRVARPTGSAADGGGERTVVCPWPLPRGVGWRQVLDSLERLGVTRLPGDGGFGNDGGFLIVEVREGARYRSYHYWAPRTDAQSPDRTRAAAALDLLDSLRPRRQ